MNAETIVLLIIIGLAAGTLSGLVGVGGGAVHQVSRGHRWLARCGQRSSRASFRNHHAMPIQKVAASARARQCSAGGSDAARTG